LLGLLDGRLRPPEELFGLFVIELADRAADRHVDADPVGGKLQRLFEGGAHPVRYLLCVLHAKDGVRVNGEFIAADPAEQVIRSQNGLDAPGDGDDQLVPGNGAKRFIDPAEADDVDHDDGLAFAGSAGARVDLLQETGPVGQGGERVGQQFAAQHILDHVLVGAVDRRVQDQCRAGRRPSDARDRDAEHAGREPARKGHVPVETVLLAGCDSMQMRRPQPRFVLIVEGFIGTARLDECIKRAVAHEARLFPRRNLHDRGGMGQGVEDAAHPLERVRLLDRVGGAGHGSIGKVRAHWTGGHRHRNSWRS
jgi:hypothetical protein